jgi:hypothetical protein
MHCTSLYISAPAVLMLCNIYPFLSTTVYPLNVVEKVDFLHFPPHYILTKQNADLTPKL